MIVIPIQFIISLALAGIGIVLLIAMLIARYIHDAIIKWRRKHSRGREKE